jgi:hypothetical protein
VTKCQPYFEASDKQLAGLLAWEWSISCFDCISVPRIQRDYAENRFIIALLEEIPEYSI